MTQKFRHIVATGAVAAALLGVATSAPAGPVQPNRCCACICQGGVSCSVEPVESCPVICAQKPDQPCDFKVLDTVDCASRPPCVAPAPAPALGTSGLTIMSLLLAGLGAFTVWRRRPH
jgi:hypothetical protein